MKRSKQDDLRGRQDWKTDETVSENIEKNGSINFGVGGNQRLFLLSIKKET